MIFDEAGRLLLLKPTYKKGWTLPGGQVDAEGESPWDACRRETLEECGLVIRSGRLACVDFRRPRRGRPGGVRFLFDCGALATGELGAIRLDEYEIEEHRFEPLAEAIELLRAPISRRVAAAAEAKRCVYLEEGRPVPAVSG